MFKKIRELFSLSDRLNYIENETKKRFLLHQELINGHMEMIREIKKDVGILKASHTKMKDKINHLIEKDDGKLIENIDFIKNHINNEIFKVSQRIENTNESLDHFKKIFDHQLGKVDIEIIKNYVRSEMNGLKIKIKKIDNIREIEERLDLRLNNADNLCKELSSKISGVPNIAQQFKNAMAIQCQKNVQEMQDIVAQYKRLTDDRRRESNTSAA